MNDITLGELTQKTYMKADLVYEFVIKYSDMMQETHDYGTGEILNMIEIHLLTHIDQNPGITSTELAKMWHRTKGSISQQVKKLEENGYISKVKHNSNGKKILLYSTLSGKELSSEHMNYDTIEIMQTVQRLLRHCTIEEIDSFYKVVGEYIKILNEG